MESLKYQRVFRLQPGLNEFFQIAKLYLVGVDGTNPFFQPFAGVKVALGTGS